MIDVLAEDIVTGGSGCGMPGRTVAFEIDSWGMGHDSLWNNAQANFHSIYNTVDALFVLQCDADINNVFCLAN